VGVGRVSTSRAGATSKKGDAKISTLKPMFSVEPDTWDAFVARRPDGHVLQTSPWGALKAQFGWSDARVGLLRGDKLVAGAQILFRRLPAGLGRLAYVPKGPLLDWSNQEESEQLLAVLNQASRSERAVAVTIEPNLEDGSTQREKLRLLRFRPAPFSAIQPRRTLVVDITPDEDDILMTMKSKTRYNIRLAGRKGVIVRKGSADDVSTFNDLLAATAERADFGIHAPGYYEAAYRLFAPRDWVRLLLAEVEGDTVAGLMVFALPPRSWYFYGASISAHREKMPTYLLQWEAMRWAKSRGCETYDLWGIPDEDRETLEEQFTERHDGLWGVYRFKRGFGGEVVRTVGTWDHVHAPLRYQLYKGALGLRDRLRGPE
jgi:lipid II:glycine glycyltransferase (peptidoglycan interpeptide bridge formation enzyme)